MNFVVFAPAPPPPVASSFALSFARVAASFFFFPSTRCLNTVPRNELRRTRDALFPRPFPRFAVKPTLCVWRSPRTIESARTARRTPPRLHKLRKLQQNLSQLHRQQMFQSLWTHRLLEGIFHRLRALARAPKIFHRLLAQARAHWLSMIAWTALKAESALPPETLVGQLRQQAPVEV